jgi:hypothetical protein
MLKNTDNAYIVQANNSWKFPAILLPTPRLQKRIHIFNYIIDVS